MDTHPSDKASNIIDASSRVKPVPPKSSLPYTEFKKKLNILFKYELI